MSFAQVVRDGIQGVLAQRPPTNTADRACFIRNLIFVWHTMRASEHLLQVAISRTDPLDALYSYFLTHLAEETGHEQWLASDLRSADVQVETTPIPREAVELVGSQYYFIFHVHPVALLGYMAMTECFPVSMSEIERLEAVHGTDLLRTMRYHAEHDLDHGADIEQQLDAVPPHLQGLVLGCAVQSARYFSAAAALFQ